MESDRRARGASLDMEMQFACKEGCGLSITAMLHLCCVPPRLNAAVSEASPARHVRAIRRPDASAVLNLGLIPA